MKGACDERWRKVSGTNDARSACWQPLDTAVPDDDWWHRGHTASGRACERTSEAGSRYRRPSRSHRPKPPFAPPTTTASRRSTRWGGLYAWRRSHAGYNDDPSATVATAAAVDLVNWFHTGVGVVDSRGVRAHRRPDQRHDPSRRREHLSGRGREAVMAHSPDVAEVVIIGVTERIGARSRSAS